MDHHVVQYTRKLLHATLSVSNLQQRQQFVTFPSNKTTQTKLVTNAVKKLNT